MLFFPERAINSLSEKSAGVSFFVFCNHVKNILRRFDGLANFPSLTSPYSMSLITMEREGHDYQIQGRIMSIGQSTTFGNSGQIENTLYL